ncbi:MAG TPA: hypothetical protein VMT34_15730 [Aggregatilineales bacterium]|nr:hypothetical protein [Aggregatilineales bacterium]
MRHVIVLGLAIVFAVFTGYVNLNSSEVPPPLLCVLTFAGLLGLLDPKRAWLWGAVIGLSIVGSYGIGVAIHYPIVDAPRDSGGILTTAVIVVPGVVAAYIGAFARRAVIRPLHSGGEPRI